MLRKSIIVVLGLLSVIVSGCTSWPVYKLEPVGDKDYYMGREIAAKEDDSARVSVEVDNYDWGRITFYVQIENKSCNKVFIEPVNFYSDIVTEDLNSIDSFYPRVYAADPEKEIKKINDDMESRKNTHSFVTGLNAVLGVLTVASDLANKEDEHKVRHVGDDVAVWANNQTNENVDYGNSLSNLDTLKQFWKNEVLRKTDLYTGEQIGGLVFTNVNPDADYIKFSIPVGINTYTFLFKKIAIK
jgi:hypothetical protein